MADTQEYVNRKLVEEYGLVGGKDPRYRVVWSDDQFEKRKGKVNQFDANGNFIRMIDGIQLRPKYDYLPHTWVLEVWQPTPAAGPDIILEPVFYEPMWSFRDNEGNPLPLVWKAVNLLLKMWEMRAENRLSPAGMDAEEKAQYDEEIDWFEQYLAADQSILADKLKDGEAVFVDSTKVLGDSNA